MTPILLLKEAAEEIERLRAALELIKGWHPACICEEQAKRALEQKPNSLEDRLLKRAMENDE